MCKIHSKLKNEFQNFIYYDGFEDLIYYLETLNSNSTNDEIVFTHSLSSIYNELSAINKAMRRRKSISEFINHWLKEKNIQRHSYIYNRGNISRAHWRKLLSEKSYEPELRTLYKLAIAFELSIEETNEFLLNFNRTFSLQSNMTDQIIAYSIKNKIYDTAVIDDILHEFGEETLFSIAD